jgi:heme exporter protein C
LPAWIKTAKFIGPEYASTGVVMGLWAMPLVPSGQVIWADPNNPAFASFGSIAKNPKLSVQLWLLIYRLFCFDSSIPDSIRGQGLVLSIIFCYAMLFPSIWIIPRLLPSLHREGKESRAILMISMPA